MGGFMQAAFEQAQMGMDEGGIPVGSVIVKDGQVLGVGRNRFSQTGDPTTHAEMEAIRDAASRASEAELATLLEGAICCTTMMPCEMCSGAIMRFGITRVVVGENQTYIDAGTQPLLESQGIAVEVLQDQDCIDLVEGYFKDHPDVAAAMRSKDRRRFR